MEDRTSSKFLWTQARCTAATAESKLDHVFILRNIKIKWNNFNSTTIKCLNNNNNNKKTFNKILGSHIISTIRIKSNSHVHYINIVQR